MAHNRLDDDAARLIRYLQRGGTKSYYLTFDANGYARATWYDSDAEPPAVPTGTNVYFGVSPCTAIPPTNAAGEPAKPENVRGRKDYIAALNCLYAEFDAKDFGNSLDETLAHVHSLALQPSVIVASGGGYHCYWLLVEPFMLDTDAARARAVDVQACWVSFVRGDKAAKDIARVLRFPGTLNYKYEPARPVAFVEQHYNRRYTLDALQAALPPVPPRTPRTPRTNAAACHTDGLQGNTAQPVDFRTISKAAAALAQLNTERRDDYASWVHVGMSLKELGTIGYELWELWSKDSPSYTVGDCDKKWPTFRVGVPGGTDKTLASLYAWAKADGGEFKHETGGELDDAERLQLQAYKARDVQTQRILAMDAPMSAKAVIVGMLPRLDANAALVAQHAEHSGSLPVNYGTYADVMRTSKATIARAVDVGEKAGLWRKDAEHVETKAGYDMLVMRLDLQPAFYHPEQATPIEQKPRGGARPGAGRKPICPDCPSGTVHRKVTSTMVTYHCAAHGEIGVEHLPALVEEYVSGTDEFKHETGTAPLADDEHVDTQHDAPAAHAENADDFKHETGVVPPIYTVSCLNKPHAACLPSGVEPTDTNLLVDVWTVTDKRPRYTGTHRERLDAAQSAALRVSQK
jgi:hypothetical protein